MTWSVAPAMGTIRNDFASYYVPARAVVEGRSLDRAYERAWFQREAEDAGLPRLGSFVPQPPPNALLLLPLAALSPLVAKAIWTLVLAAALVGSFLVLRGVVPLPPAVLALVFLCPSASLHNALAYGQPYPLILLFLCLSLRAAARGRDVSASLWLSPVLALKLYGAPFLLYFALRRRWRALAGAVGGVLLIGVVSAAVLGRPVHAAYLREVLPASLAGRIQDPYSTIWQSATSLSHRLFQRESDLNPDPLTDRPAVARGLARGIPAVILLAGALAAAASVTAGRAYAILTVAALAASPLTSSYHFLLLVLPLAVLLGDGGLSPLRRAAIAIAFALATSPLPHYFGRFASGWGNLLAYPRLALGLAILAIAIGGTLASRAGLMAVVAAAGIGATAALKAPSEQPWERVPSAGGYFSGDPEACAGGLSWLTIADDRLVRVWTGRRCPAHVAPPGADARLRRAWELGDADVRGAVAVFIDEHGELRERVGREERLLASGPARHPRLSPDAAWVASQVWRGSWDIWAVDRASGRAVIVTRDSAGEMEPAWEADGRALVFASDRRRGLGSTALYRLPFRPD